MCIRKIFFLFANSRKVNKMFDTGVSVGGNIVEKVIDNKFFTDATPITGEPYLPNQIIKPITDNNKYIRRKKLLNQIYSKYEKNNTNIVYLRSNVGGMGKSELAREYAENFSNNKYKTTYHTYYNRDLKNTIAKINFYNRKNDYKYENALKILYNYKEDTLIIIDNYSCKENDYSIIEDLKKLKIHFLFTTRNNIENAFEVPKMTEKQLVSLFKKNNTTINNEEKIKQIIKITESHIFLIVLIAKLLNKYPDKLDKVLDLKIKSDDIKSKIKHVKDAKLKENTIEFLEELFNFSKIPKKQLKILKHMCIVPLSGIDREIFIKLINLSDENLLENLIDDGWIISETKDERIVISLHPLIKKLLCSKFSKELTFKFYKKYIKILTNETDKQNKSPKYSEAKPYIDIALSTAEFFENSEEKNKNVAELFISVSLFLVAFAYYDDELRLLNKAIIILENNVNNKKLLATTYNNLGSVYKAKGETDKAIEYYNKALEIIEKVLPANHPNFATIYNDLGGAYYGMGDLDKAIEYYNKALEISKKVLPENHPDLATTYNNLGGAYYGMGDLDKAIEYLEKALEISKKVLPENHPYLATTYGNLGGVYQDKGEIDKAIEYYNKVLEIFKKVLPENHPYIASTYNNLGGVYHDKGEIDKAIEYYNKALEISKKVLPENHPDLATTYNNLGLVYHDKGETDKAIEYSEKALKINKISLPPTHPSTKNVYFGIIAFYIEMEKPDEAMQYLNEMKEFCQMSDEEFEKLFE